MERLFYLFACVALTVVIGFGCLSIGYLSYVGGRLMMAQTEASGDLVAVLDIVNSKSASHKR